MKIVCQQTFLIKYHALFSIFAANCRWRFKGKTKKGAIIASILREQNVVSYKSESNGRLFSAIF